MINYLRISLTDRCNLNCQYCQPMASRKVHSHHDLLRYEEIVRVVNCFAKCGITKIRVTGGEPLIKKNIWSLISRIKDIDGIDEVSITTNGVLLEKQAKLLKSGNLDRINISLDTLDRDRYRTITGADKLDDVLKGIQAVGDAGFTNTKLNVVLLQDINDDEILDFVEFASKNGLILRFIELFETNREIFDFKHKSIDSLKVKEIIESKYGTLTPVKLDHNNGPSENYAIPSKNNLKVGFISNNSTDFCKNCSRLRINCLGKVSPCLFSGFIHDIGSMVKEGKSDDEIVEYISAIILNKRDFTKSKNSCGSIEMSGIGG